ncbi:MAG: hypothetical protein ACFFG0_00225 [Candidatus Thorarchaeota archaeon]
MKKFLNILDTNKIIYFKNREVRTPVTIEVTDDELKKLHIALRMADVQNFTITENKVDTKKEDITIIIDESKDIVIEELEEVEKEPSTILEELMRNGEE